MSPYNFDALGLMVAILRGSADLRGAACVGHARLFDIDVRASEVGHADETHRWAAVAAICQTCPVRGRCWEWASVQPSTRFSGPAAATSGNPFLPRGRQTRTPGASLGPKLRARADITGDRFGSLVASEPRVGGQWLCQCDCGNTTVVAIGNLRTGNAKSCGDHATHHRAADLRGQAVRRAHRGGRPHR